MPLPMQMNQNPQNFYAQSPAFRADTGQQFTPRTGFNKWLKGNPDYFRQMPKYSSEIQGSINQLLQQGFQGLQNPYQGFDDISNEATRKYNTETIPGIAERFASVPGGQRSSGYLATLGGSGEDFQSKLAAMKEMFGQRNKQQSLDQIGFGLKNQPGFSQFGRQAGALEGFLGPYLQQQGKQQFGHDAGEWIKALTSILPFLL